MSGAAPLAPELTKRLMDRLVGAAVINGYGLTETRCVCQSSSSPIVSKLTPSIYTLSSPGILLLHPSRSREKVGTVGELLPNMHVRLVDEDGVDVKRGEAGELWVQGPNVMK